MGHSVNLLPVRSRCEGGLPFTAYLQTLKQLMLDAHDHQNFTYGNLIQKLNLPRDSSRVPLLSVSFNVIRAPRDVQFSGLAAEFSLAPKGFNVFDLSVDVVDTEAELRLDCRFNLDLFEAPTMQRWLGHWQTLLEATIKQPERAIAELPVLDDAERQRILVEWNHTEASFPQNECLPQLFEAQVRHDPNAIALAFDGQRLTYHELNQRANRLAHYLKQQGVGAETLVAVCLERSFELVIGLLAILKAGGAYVPLDPNYPSERLEFILQDARAAMLLTQESLLKNLPGAPRVICLDPELSAIGTQSETNSIQGATQENLAYVLYTSGSTGKPKGVQISHRALVNFLCSMGREPGLAASDILLAVTTLSFDIAGLELWLPLTVGAQVVIARSDTAREAKRLAALLQECRATVMQATPATWRMLLEAGWQGNPRLKVLCGGEAWGRDLAEALLPECGSLWNMYGPTETTIWSGVTRVEPGDSPMIGRPIANTQFYVLDARMQPVPIGVAGELHIGGEGLARGYLNRPELTKEKFVADPFHTETGARLYKTGDLVRHHASGKIEFLGRMDHQVKIRGFRIELGEIETVLRRHPNVREATVTARDDQAGGKRLVAYAVARQPPPPTTRELQDLLAGQLPDYMMPAAFVMLDALPLTPNGKVDRKSLPEPEGRIETEEFVPPSTPAELAMAKLWCEVLGVKQVGLNDNFFLLGGHSLMATQLISRLEKFHQVEVSLRDVFDSPTITAMSRWLEKKETKIGDPSVPSLVPLERRNLRPRPSVSTPA
ncbi:MAG: Amino acid adenylation domain protein [Pedosphaera sp.]|nr:Amino acid adenylation domain protein [Pedosphaera sp.]